MSKKIHVTTTVNHEPVEFLCEPRQSLLEVLRDTLRLTGAKEGCNNGNCGACTVILDGVPVNSCLVLAVEAEGATDRDRRGARRARPSASRSSSASWKAPPCSAGSARPVSWSPPRHCSTRTLIPREHDIRFNLANNLCRCTGYDKIVKAVQAAARELQSLAK